MRSFYAWAFACLLALPLAAADFFPLDQVRPGMQGVGRTVFAGDRVEEFQVEILGVMENIGPQQSLILAKLSGGPLAETGLMAGMSGSPIYLQGRLAGAVAYSFPFSTEPIAGIRPIEEMVTPLRSEAAPTRDHDAPLAAVRPNAERSSQPFPLGAAVELLPPAPAAASFEPRLTPVATSVGLAGFSERTFEVFGPKLRNLGLQPMQGIGGRSRSSAPERPLEPGSMISVALVRGDLDLSASGTVTHVEGDRIYAFGHRFLSSGPTKMPFMKASVIAVVPNLSNSFKIAGSGSLLGAITEDRSTGVAGQLGSEARLLPMKVDLRSSLGREHAYDLELVDDRFLTPFLLQMAMFSVIDASERQLGAASVRLTGTVDFAANDVPPLRLDNMFSGASNLPMEVATATAIPLAYLMQSGFDDLAVRAMTLRIESLDEELRTDIERIWVSDNNVRPGETIQVAAALRGTNGEEIIKKTDYQVPLGAAPGPLNITVADANTFNAQEWRAFVNPRQAATAGHLVRAMNRLRRNDRLYVRVWRPARGFVLQTERLPSPPPSIAGILSLPATTGGEVQDEWQSTIAEIEIDDLDSVVHGHVTTRITVTE